MILVSLENVKKFVFRVVAQLPQRLKSTLFEISFERSGPEGASEVRQTVHCPTKMRPKLLKSYIVLCLDLLLFILHQFLYQQQTPSPTTQQQQQQQQQFL